MRRMSKEEKARLPNPKMEITTLLSTYLCQAMLGVMRLPARHPKFPRHISLVVTSLRFALISNYVYWMFFMVSSVHAMGCQEKKY